MCAAVGVGSRSNLEDSASEMAGALISIEPGTHLLEFYADRFAEWKTKYRQLREMAEWHSGGH